MSEENKERGEETRPRPEKRVSRRTLLASLGMAGAAAVLGVSVAAVNGSGAEMREANGTRVTTMDELRAMTGEADPSLVYYVTDPGREGHFYCDAGDPVSGDDDGTILVTASGVRYKRIRETEYTNVKWFGAKGDGSHDDFTAIQAAIDAVSLQGGGTVFFPKGTYIVSPYLSKWIKLKDNVNLLGEGTSSVIKVKDDAGDYFAIFYGSTSEPLRNVRISNLKFDQNPQNNLSCHIDLDRKDTRYFFQFCIISYRYENIAIDNVQFDPTSGVNSISLNSDTGKLASITNCYFNFVLAKGNGTYDNSAIYLNGRNHLVANCLFHAGPGQKARGAIETHLGQSTITNNVMDGYYTGVNLQAGNVSGSDDRCDMTITGNTISNANQGIQIGPYKTFPVKNVTVSGNTISLSNLRHKRGLTTGIASASWTNDSTFFENITVTGNTIVFEEELEPRADMQALAYGIGFTHNSDIRNVVISNNIVKNAPITGIQLGSFQKAGVVSNALITGNVIVNAGHYPTKVESYRAGIALRSTVIGARISGNLISDTYDEPKGVCSIRISDGEGTYTDVEVTGNQIRTNQGGLWLLLSPSVRTDVRPLVFTSPVYPPAAGTYRPGDIVWITGLNSKDGITPVGCKAVSEGTSGTLSGIRAAGEAGQPVITVSDASPFETGQWIRIAAGNQVRKIVRIAGSEVRLETPLATAIQGTSPVTYAAPLWNPFGRLGSLAPVDDTNGATLSEIEGEVNRLKEVLRTYGIVGR
ncbi:glycosyl hydrolase family 28-related protein [Paenibacillus sp. GYB004]|uniref:glycosyl hydrolase family 28-related protein n=1 Tax=Paenibacillus sp. GYB004 TaxID=2994393 RepID=UPI002F967A93